MRPINMMISNYNYKKGDASRIQYIVIHYTGGFGTAKDNCRYFAGGDRKASAHYFVGYEGEIWQSVEDRNIAWHCGAKKYRHPDCRNGNSIGIELCVRKRNQDSKSAEDQDWYFEDVTVEAAVELTRYLMKKYNVPASRVLRHYDVTGKVCPAPYVHNTTQHTWKEFQTAISRKEREIDWLEWIKKLLPVIGKFLQNLLQAFLSGKHKPEKNLMPIMGRSHTSAGRIAAYIVAQNPSAAYCAQSLAQMYIEEGASEGVRGDVAAAQAMLETGNLTYAGSAVTPDQNNFCGMGVTQNGMKGCSFKSMRDGVRAQIQHLKAYASKEQLSQECIDPRYDYVKKGCAPYVEWLGKKENPEGYGWASGERYGYKICRILEEMQNV